MNLQKLQKQAAKMMQQANEAQKKLGEERFTGEAGGGAVTITVSGLKELIGVKVSKEAAEDTEMLEDLFIAAWRDAATKADEASQSLLGSMTGGMGMPGMGF